MELGESCLKDQVSLEAYSSARLMSRAGKPVTLSSRRLREQYVPGAADILYTRVLVDGELVGNAFACRWIHNSKSVCWITQLVVAWGFRERGLASGLLRSFRTGAEQIYGIMSSHPVACLAAARCFGSEYYFPQWHLISKTRQQRSSEYLSSSFTKTLAPSWDLRQYRIFRKQSRAVHFSTQQTRPASFRESIRVSLLTMTTRC